MTQKSVADSIAAESGYFYVIQHIGGKEVYSFAENEELRQLVSQDYGKREWFVSNRLNF